MELSDLSFSVDARPDAARRPIGRGGAARRHVNPALMARRLGGIVRWPGALEVRERSWRLVAQTEEFDAWLIAWPVGGTIDLHDHGGSRGAFHVIGGSLVETTPGRDDAGQLALTRKEVHAGATLAFGAGHVHDVRNESSTHALSLHVYSPSLTSMVYYECFEGRLVPRAAHRDPARDDATARAEPDLRLVGP